jgi:nucleoside-diphosphate-sugar epimerase
LGTLQDDVTHIIDLPMRAKLNSVVGNGTDLEFTFLGEGKVVLDLKNPYGFNLSTEGANSTTLNGEILEMNFNGLSLHTGKVKLALDAPPTVANPIADVSVNEDAPNTDILKTFADISKTRDLLGFEPKIKIEDGLKRFADFIAVHPNN